MPLLQSKPCCQVSRSVDCTLRPATEFLIDLPSARLQMLCRRERAAQIPGLTREYVHQLLASDPLHLMTLALTDMSLDFTNRANSMMNGGLYAHRTRMDCALLCYAHQPAQFTEGLPELSAHAAAIRDRNMAHNPLLQRYKTMAERPDPHLGVALLSAEHVAGLLNNHRDRSPLGLDGLDIVDARIDLVTVGNELSLNQCPSWRVPFNVNDLVLREGRADGAAAPLPPVAMRDADGHLAQLPDGVALSLSAEAVDHALARMVVATRFGCLGILTTTFAYDWLLVSSSSDAEPSIVRESVHRTSVLVIASTSLRDKACSGGSRRT